VVFRLHNFGYRDRSAFIDCSAVIFPSEYSRRHHAKLFGLDCPVIADPIPLERIVAEKPQPTYATFIKPQLPKGMTVFARTALEKLWDNPEFESSHRALARAEARRWQPDRVADQFERLFRPLGGGVTAR
jgi:glycosyltransferase involved in cell wall biosynthesis